MQQNTGENAGYTLIELLVVISITALLSSVILVSTTNAREKARIASARANLRQLSTGFNIYFGTYGQYPPQKYVNGVLTPPDHCEFCTTESGYLFYAQNTWDDVINKLTNEGIMTGPRLDPWGRPYTFDNNYKQKCYGCHSSPLCSTGRNGVFESMGYYSGNAVEGGDDVCVFLEGNP